MSEQEEISAKISMIEELHTMQLAAISVACFQNTEVAIEERIGKDNPYWTVAYSDVLKTVDREILWRETLRQVAPNLYAKILVGLVDGKQPLSLLQKG